MIFKYNVDILGEDNIENKKGFICAYDYDDAFTKLNEERFMDYKVSVQIKEISDRNIIDEEDIRKYIS